MPYQGNLSGKVINWEDPLSKGLIGAWVRRGNLWVDAAGIAPTLVPYAGGQDAAGPGLLGLGDYSSYPGTSDRGNFNLNFARFAGRIKAISMAVWLSPTAGDARIPFFVVQNGGESGFYIQQIVGQSGIRFRGVSSDGTNAPITADCGDTGTGWHFVVVTFTTNQTTCKVDAGTTQTSTSTVACDWYPRTVSIGAALIQSYTPFPYHTQGWVGLLTRPMLWNRVITEAEKAQLYATKSSSLFVSPRQMPIAASTAVAATTQMHGWVAC